MKKQGLFVLLLWFVDSINAQNYISYLNCANEAEYYYSIGSYSKAQDKFVYLEKTFKRLLPKDYFYLGLIYYHQKDSINGFLNLKKSWMAFGEFKYKLEQIRTENPSLYVSQNKLIILDSIQKSNLCNRKASTVDTLKYFENWDQKNRSSDDINTSEDIKLQNLYLKYLKSTGIPSPYLYGDLWAEIFLHVYDKNIFKKYKRFLFKEIKKGNLLPFYYAIMIDRFCFQKNKKQPFLTTSTELNAALTEKVKRNRLKIGLSNYYNGPGLFPK